MAAPPAFDARRQAAHARVAWYAGAGPEDGAEEDPNLPTKTADLGHVYVPLFTYPIHIYTYTSNTFKHTKHIPLKSRIQTQTVSNSHKCPYPTNIFISNLNITQQKMSDFHRASHQRVIPYIYIHIYHIYIYIYLYTIYIYIFIYHI